MSRPTAPVEIFDPRTYARGVPYELLARLRREASVWWVDEPAVLGWPAGPGYWAVLRHADVKHVLRTPDAFSSHLGATQLRDPPTPEDLAFVQRMMLNMDPPEHARLRRLVGHAFTPRAVAALEAAIARRARELVAAVADRGEADLVTDVTADLPVTTLAAVMGVPPGDRRLLYDWANRIIGYQDDEYAASSTVVGAELSPMGRAAVAARPVLRRRPGDPPVNPRSRAALADMFAYADGLAEHKRAHPGDDVLSLLLRAEHDGTGVTREEFQNMFFLFAVAGNETLRNGIPGGLLTLLEHPGELARLRDDRGLVNPAVEEMLRYWPPVVHFRRTATRDVELDGQAVRRGDKVVVYHASANRDEAVFADPDRFDVGRSPNDHVSFGYGPHFCLGAHLARTQMRAMLCEVLERLPGLELAGAPVGLQSNFQNGLKHLPVRWDGDAGRAP